MLIGFIRVFHVVAMLIALVAAQLEMGVSGFRCWRRRR